MDAGGEIPIRSDSNFRESQTGILHSGPEFISALVINSLATKADVP